MSGKLSFSDAIECYETIGQSLASAVRAPWELIVVDAELQNVEVTLVKSYQDPDGRYHDMPFVPILGECFYTLARLVSSEQKGLYKKCHYVLEPSGKYNANFEY
jgi:hypothetical protein